MSRSNALLVNAANALIRRKYPNHPLPQFEIALRDVPGYAAARLGNEIRRRRHTPPAPWITTDAIHLLDTMLKSDDDGLEFGSGGSTIWFARRTRSIRAVESADAWLAATSARIASLGLSNVSLELASITELGYRTSEHESRYINAYPDLSPGSLGYVFVDGEYRDRCALRAIDLLRSGGLLILDNANNFLPTPTRTLLRLTKPSTDDWASFTERVSSWRAIWTSNGAWATAIWVKP